MFTKYFIDLSNGETLQISQKQVETISADIYQRIFGKPASKRSTVVCRVSADTEGAVKYFDTYYTHVTRVVKFNNLPLALGTAHECDSRCLHATGRVMNCECACGGKNHGKK
jgi:hypothetical protein